MSTKRKPSPAQLAARKLFAERARAGTLKKGKKKTTRKRNPIHEVTELVLYADSTAELEPRKESIIKNLKNKVNRGKYDPEKAAKAWKLLVDDAVRQYNKEFLNGEYSLRQSVFTIQDRKDAAKKLEENWRKELYINNPKMRKQNPSKGYYGVFISPSGKKVSYFGTTNGVNFCATTRKHALQIATQKEARELLSKFAWVMPRSMLNYQLAVISANLTTVEILREFNKKSGK